MGEKRGYKIFKIIMLIILVAFVTFIITAVGTYQFLKDNDKLGKTLVVTSSDNGEIASELSKYKMLIDKYFLGETNIQNIFPKKI